MGKETDDLIAPGQRRSRRPSRAARWTCCSPPASARRWRCCAWRSPTSASRPSAFTGSQAGIITDTVAHARPRSSRSRATGSATALAAGKVAVVAGFQGVSTDERDHLPRPGRLRHHRRGPRGRARGRRLRDLHRRHRRVHRRPPHRAARPASWPASASTRCSRWRPAGGRVLGAALGRVRPQPRRAAPRPLELHLGAGHLGHRGGADDGRSDHLRRHPRRREAKVTIAGVPDQPGHRGRAVPAAGRRRRQRRHDRAEHVERRARPTSLHRARRPTWPRAEAIVQRVAAEIGASGVTHDADIAKVSASSAPA